MFLKTSWTLYNNIIVIFLIYMSIQYILLVIRALVVYIKELQTSILKIIFDNGINLTI